MTKKHEVWIYNNAPISLLNRVWHAGEAQLVQMDATRWETIKWSMQQLKDGLKTIEFKACGMFLRQRIGAVESWNQTWPYVGQDMVGRGCNPGRAALYAKPG